MNSVIVKRSLLLIATFVMLTQCCFLILYYAPNSPFEALSFFDAYIFYFDHLLQGDLGMSVKNNASLWVQLQQCIPITLELFLLAFLVAIIIGIPLGLLAGMKKNRWQEILIQTAGLLVSSSPIVWVCLMAILFFSPHLNTALDYGQLPIKHVTGFFFIDIWYDHSPQRASLVWTVLKQVWLPVGVLSLYTTMIMTYFLSESTAVVIKKNYIKAAATRGLSTFNIIWRHILPNAFPRIIPQLILQLSLILFLTMMVEIVFNIPGIGYWSLQAYKNQEVIYLSSAILIMSSLVILTNLIANIVSAIVTPIKYKEWYASQ